MLRKEDWMEIKELVEKGVYKKDTAEESGVSAKTITRALARKGALSKERPNARCSKLDPFKPLVGNLLSKGVWNGKVILEELKARGYTGGSTIIRDYMKPRRSLRPSRATARFETPPDHQLQHDRGEIVTVVAGHHQKVYFSANTERVVERVRQSP